MSVDHQQLPREEPEPATPPSKLVWGIVFIALLAAGGAATVLLWPKHMPTSDWRFWTTVIVVPAALASFVVLRRFSAYEAAKLDVQARNEVVSAYNQCIVEAASKPFAVLAAAYRFSCERKENALDKVHDRSMKLVSQVGIAADAPPVQARWLIVPSVKLAAGSLAADKKRHFEAVKWLFGELLGELVPAIKAMPQMNSLDIHFVISSLLSTEERNGLWNDKWGKLDLGRADIAIDDFCVDLMALDRWLDRTIETDDSKARLIIAIQLNFLQSTSPSPGSAEAAVALLLLPKAEATRHALVSAADLHRPVRGGFEQANEALGPALKWGESVAPDIKGIWETGLDATQWGQVVSEGGLLGLPNNAIKIDQSIGFAGVAAPWLAVSVAARSLSDTAPKQMVFAGSENTFDCAVIVQSATTSASPSSTLAEALI
ncbi:MAG: hypothetical protein M3O74_24735 [Pseudomonadota bacterium]|nr:hypothetical protein [Pseudomonadota bacterium]